MTQAKRDPSVIVIGAGMTGILLTIKLLEAGITNIKVFEKSHKLGGTWRENTYPGVACDVPSHMYTYSFEPNPNWSNMFARGAEIQGYFEQVAEKYQVLDYVRFNHAVTSSVLKGNQWLVTTNDGEEHIADFVISATGILHHPAYPDIPGLKEFKGEMFHTAKWNHKVKIDESTKVGVIGTGSTAAQAIPELINTGADVSVFQRTPQWLLPWPDIRFPDWVKRFLSRHPSVLNLSRKFGQLMLEHFFTKAVTGHFIQKKILSAWCKANLKFAIKDKQLREKLTPDYQVGCKRVVVNKTYYAAIQKDNAHLVTDSIDKITEKGVLTKDGKLHELDVLVLSTGFDPMAYMRPMNLVGRDGLHVNDAWKAKVLAYRSILLPNFPNFFLMLGPNTPIGNFSVIAMSEVQTKYILQLIDKWRNNGFDSVEPSTQAAVDFNQYIKDGLKGTSWVGGCQSWYLDKEGVPILWPYTWQRWVDEMEKPDYKDLVMERS